MRNKILIHLILSVVVTGLMPTIASAASIKGWGYDDYGQATPPAGNNYIAIAAGSRHSLALRSDGSIVAWGAGTVSGNWPHFGQASPPAGNNFVAIAAGWWHSLALLCVNPRSDLNGDCKVDFADFAIMAGEWLSCGLSDQQQCWP